MASTVEWGHAGLAVVLDTPEDGPVGVRSLSTTGRELPAPATQPLVEVLTPGTGRARAGPRFSDTTVGRRLRFAGSDRRRDGGWHELRIALRDPDSGLTARVTLRSADGVGAVQVRTEVRNGGDVPVLLLGVTSWAAGLGGHPVDRLDLVHGVSEWLGEGRWRRAPLRAALADLGLTEHGQPGRGCVAAVSTGAWSTGAQLPTGALVDRATGDAWLWQIEHNGAWRWEVGERLDGPYLALSGPTDRDHQWQQWLTPGESFTSVPVSLAVGADGLDSAVATLTAHRRRLRRPHRDRAALPVVFNDYMNTLMGDPTTAKLLPLIDAAAAAGAEVFCVDAGWYDNGSAWWDSVGEWQPSQTRFPRGFEEVLTRIRDRGLVPGLWLEPEVVGVRSPVAEKLPPEAFLQRGGVRVVENGRYHLDLRHPRAVAHLDEVVDRLVEQLGVGYLKLDYNIDPGAGTDVDADSPGAGLLGHNRAHLAWLDRILDRHADLVLENCASGAMRMDYALLARVQLQSTSDQQDFRRYPPIAVAAPLSVLPEQAANWAYPQPEMSSEALAFALSIGFLGRLYLSGRLDRMRPEQLASVRDAVTAYRAVRTDLAAAVPVWPLGLPGWTDRWLSLALCTPDVTYLGVWRRDGAAGPVTLPLPHLRGRRSAVDVLYPRHLPEWGCDWDTGTGVVTVTPTAGEPFAARILRIETTTDIREGTS